MPPPKLLFLYREVLEKELPWMDGMVRAKRTARVPVVLTENEVRALLAQLDGTRWLAASLLYATGMRLLEGLRLRVKDVDFERREITVRDGKGGRDRRTMLSERLIEPLRSRASILTRAAAGPGNTCFLPAAARSPRIGQPGVKFRLTAHAIEIPARSSTRQMPPFADSVGTTSAGWASGPIPGRRD